MSRDEIALRIFCALLGRADAKIDLYPDLAETQIKTCFMMADVFLRIAWQPTPVNNEAKF